MTDDEAKLTAAMRAARRNGGGPAFPTSNGGSPDDGMTLRDYFAAKAMAAQLITDGVPGEAYEALAKAARLAGHTCIYHLCVNSYEIADDMLKARQA